MEEKQEQYSSQELEQRIKKLDGRFKNFIRGTKLGSTGLFGGLLTAFLYTFITFPGIPEKPQVMNNYVNAQATVQKLERVRDNLSSRLEVPYETQKVREVLDNIYADERQKLSQIEEAIQDVKGDMTKIEQNPEYVAYQQENEKFNNRANKFDRTLFYLLGAGVLTIVGSFIGAALTDDKRSKLKKQLKQPGEEK